MTRRIDGMVIAITGASAGIGEAIARELAGRGAKLALCARRLDKVQSLSVELGGEHLVAQTDVADPQQCEAFMQQTIDRFGRLDVLIANAGYGQAEPTWQISHDDAQRMFAVNVLGTLDCVRPAVKQMKTQDLRDGYRGQLMIMSSAAARRGMPFMGVYCATKAAQLSFAEAWRVELEPDRIAVTSIHPIGTTTEFGKVVDEKGTHMLNMAKQGRVQTAEHVARRCAKAIEKPVREVWPAREYRFLLGLNSLAPGIGDRILRSLRNNAKAK